MDTTISDPNNRDIKPIDDTGTELAHIAQEIYKKNFELAEINKTLSLLRRLDELMLGSITDTHQISQQVSDAILKDANFEIVAIYLLEKKGVLNKVAISKSISALSLEQHLNKPLFPEEVSLENSDNSIAKCVMEIKLQILQDVKLLINQNNKELTSINIDGKNSINSILIYPLKNRKKILGVLAIGIKENSESLSSYLIDMMERLVNILGIGIDNTLLYQEIKQANEHLKELDRLKDDFVSVASHELRTPMTAIKSYLWMALAGRGGELSEKLRYYLDRSYNSVDRLIKLVNDMLNISRIDSGRLTLIVQKSQINSLAREVIEELNPRLLELGIEISFTNTDSIPDVLADPDKIKEVLYNLIGNSMKFTPRGGKITISINPREDKIEIEIKDTGVGITQENLPKLFEKFSILPGTYVTNQPSQGTGLGLYICKSIVELHGGTIKADSDGKGKGASFTFTLKIFSQDELSKFNTKYNQNSNPDIGLIHTQI